MLRLKHLFSETSPLPNEVSVGELVLRIGKQLAELYTKDFNGNILTIGKGVARLEDLEDLDLTNVTEGSFIVKQGDKFIAMNQVGSISNLTDVEINNPVAGEYLRYDSVYGAFRNFRPSYNLYELLDVDVIPSNLPESETQNDHVLYYSYTDSKFKTRERINTLVRLHDVELTDTSEDQILILDEDGTWKNKNLQIEKDSNPVLGGNLNANRFNINNLTYKVVRLIANQPIIEANYSVGDYFVIEGVLKEDMPQCIVNVKCDNLPNNSSALILLEVRQVTNTILIGGLENVKYEDGRPILLSGDYKTDLININIQKVNDVITTYITAVALNLAQEGLGGIPANRYDKNRYPQAQNFDSLRLYDNYFEYVQLLLTFEEQISTNKTWLEDKSNNSYPITSNINQKETTFYNLGMIDYVGEFDTNGYLDVNTTSNDIVLNSDFTLEFYINYSDKDLYISQDNILHNYLFSNELKLYFTGSIDTGQNTELKLELGNLTYTFVNAYLFFNNRFADYIHIAIVRKQGLVSLYLDGVIQHYKETVVINNNIVIISNPTINIEGNLNSVRITKYARYSSNFTVPNMRFGLVGGYNNFLESLVFDLYSNIGYVSNYNPVANSMFI